MFGLGLAEIVVVLVIALLVLGPEKLPGIAKQIGKGLREFRRAASEFQAAIQMSDDFMQREQEKRPPPKHSVSHTSESETSTESPSPPVKESTEIQNSIAQPPGDTNPTTAKTPESETKSPSRKEQQLDGE